MHWQHDDWKSHQSWDYWRSSTWTETVIFLSNSTKHRWTCCWSDFDSLFSCSGSCFSLAGKFQCPANRREVWTDTPLIHHIFNMFRCAQSVRTSDTMLHAHAWLKFKLCLPQWCHSISCAMSHAMHGTRSTSSSSLSSVSRSTKDAHIQKSLRWSTRTRGWRIHWSRTTHNFRRCAVGWNKNQTRWLTSVSFRTFWWMPRLVVLAEFSIADGRETSDSNCLTPNLLTLHPHSVNDCSLLQRPSRQPCCLRLPPSCSYHVSIMNDCSSLQRRPVSWTDFTGIQIRIRSSL